jgi:hypothetical protein
MADYHFTAAALLLTGEVRSEVLRKPGRTKGFGAAVRAGCIPQLLAPLHLNDDLIAPYVRRCGEQAGKLGDLSLIPRNGRLKVGFCLP